MTRPTRTSPAGIELIKAHEGLRLAAYPDPGTGGEPWTIGYGHTGGVRPGDRITADEAERILRDDLAWAEQAVAERVSPMVDLTQHQFDALVSLVFNIGRGAFERSTLLRKINTADVEGAAREFSRWVHAGGRVLPGLVRRRQAEAELFRRGAVVAQAPASPQPAAPPPSQQPTTTIYVPQGEAEIAVTVPAPPAPAAAPEPPPHPAATPQPPAIAQEAPAMPLPAIIAAVLPTLVQALPSLAQIVSRDGTVDSRREQAAQLVVQIVQQATGASNAQAAAEAVAADPALAAQADQAIRDRWYELQPAGGGIEAARAADLAHMQAGSMWRSPAFFISLLLLAFPALLLVDVLFVHPEAYTGELRVQVVTAVLAIIAVVAGYWIGTSWSSARKDEARR
jgi:lysozyme